MTVAGNFSLTATLLKRFALVAAKYLPSREVMDYSNAGKLNTPSGTARELAEALGEVGPSELAFPIDQTHGNPDARRATIGGTPVHSLRLPGYVLTAEELFGFSHDRLTIRHDAGKSAAP
ncbi:MAG: hypothetical protein C0467_31840 [Planctomycetaceae bacterium]|nr:hypothetical protein [Planctomycetaceae bacterium]